ncbi:hypothetical protein RB598_007300 [Gaeumannomyces tritici]
MTGRGGGGGRRILLPPINFIFKLLQSHAPVQIWLYEQLGIRIEGKIRGFDEFMNLVLDDAVEIKANPSQGRQRVADTGLIIRVKGTARVLVVNRRVPFCLYLE